MDLPGAAHSPPWHARTNTEGISITRIVTIEELRSLAGREIGATDWLTVDQHMIDAFAQASGDHQWIHVDQERAKKESPYGRTIAHGFLTLSLLSRLSNDVVEVRGDFGRRINYGLNRLRFPAPVPEGSRIRARFALRAFEDIEGGHQIVWLATVDVEGSEKPALVAWNKIDLADRKRVETIFRNSEFGPVVHLAAQAGVRYSL